MNRQVVVGANGCQPLLHVLLLVALASCEAPEVTPLPLATLVQQAHAYDGRQVAVTGTLRSYPAPLHYWVEDRTPNRVGVIASQPLAPYLNQRVKVQGRFTFDPSQGRQITVGQLILLSPATP